MDPGETQRSAGRSEVLGTSGPISWLDLLPEGTSPLVEHFRLNPELNGSDGVEPGILQNPCGQNVDLEWRGPPVDPHSRSG